MRLSKADIVARAATKTKDIPVPEWNVGKDKAIVTIKAWSIADRDVIFHELRQRLSGVEVRTLAPHVCAVSLVDEDGELMFGSEDGIAALNKMAHEGLVRIANAAYHFNGLGWFATDEEGEKLRGEAVKNKSTEAEEQAENSPN